jgi:hypothetical protein
MSNDNWELLFRENRHAELALRLRDSKRGAQARCLGDDQVVLLGGAAGAGRESKRLPKDREVLSVVLTPEPDQSDDQFEDLVRAAREEHPHAEFSGHAGEAKPELFDCLALKLGLADKEFESEKLQSGHGKPLIAVLSYTPEVDPDALVAACRKAADLPGLQSVVPLPLGAGDRIPLKGFTTSGTTDLMVISVLRHFLPAQVRVRASWAALGWKVAQLGLLYGADELAGWSAAEGLVYGGRVRAAARVESEEVELGVEEARRAFVAWLSLKGAVR